MFFKFFFFSESEAVISRIDVDYKTTADKHCIKYLSLLRGLVGGLHQILIE